MTVPVVCPQKLAVMLPAVSGGISYTALIWACVNGWAKRRPVVWLRWALSPAQAHSSPCTAARAASSSAQHKQR